MFQKQIGIFRIQVSLLTCDEQDKQQPETTTQINDPPTIELRQECFVRRCEQTITGRNLRYNRSVLLLRHIWFVMFHHDILVTYHKLISC